MNKKCEECLKNDVCRYMDDFNDFVELHEKLSDSEFAKVSIECKFYLDESNTIPWGTNVRSPLDNIQLTPWIGDPMGYPPTTIITYAGETE